MGSVDGTVCRVEFGHEDGHVRKRPHHLTAAQLHARMEDLLTEMRARYFGDGTFGKPPVLPTELVSEEDDIHIRQKELVGGRPLARLTDDEIRSLDPEELYKILDLILCSTTLYNEIGNFIDLFGFDDEIKNPWVRFVRTLNVRYSTNIWVDAEGKITLIDADFYHRPERSLPRKVAAHLLTPVMLCLMGKFRREIEATLATKSTPAS